MTDALYKLQVEWSPSQFKQSSLLGLKVQTVLSDN